MNTIIHAIKNNCDLPHPKEYILLSSVPLKYKYIGTIKVEIKPSFK
jgi:hypothetical protein